MSETFLVHRWEVNGTPTNVTSIALSDPTGAFGVRRVDTEEVVVADGTAMTNTETGVYSYSFTDPDDGLEYEYWLEIVYDGQTLRFQYFADGGTTTGTALDTFFVELRRSLGRYLGWGRTEDSDWTARETNDADDFIKEALQKFYFPPVLPNERRAHQWSFLSPTLTITTSAPYSTGTVEIASGVVTLSGGTFPTWAASGELQVEGGNYAVSVRGSGTEITLSDTSVTLAAGATYTLIRTRYDLPSDYAMMNGPLTYSPGNVNGGTVEEVSEYMIRTSRNTNAGTGRPHSFHVLQKPFDATVGERSEMLIFPPADAVYQLFGRYSVLPETLTSVNKYPHGGAMHANTIRESLLSIAELQLNDGPGVHANEFLVNLQASILRDRQADAVDNMGSMTLCPEGGSINYDLMRGPWNTPVPRYISG